VTGVIQCIIYEPYASQVDATGATVNRRYRTEEIVNNLALQYMINYSKLFLPMRTYSSVKLSSNQASSAIVSPKNALISLLQSIAAPLGANNSSRVSSKSSSSGGSGGIGSNSVMYTLDYCNNLSSLVTNLSRTSSYVTYAPHIQSSSGEKGGSGRSTNAEIFQAYFQHLLHHLLNQRMIYVEMEKKIMPNNS